MGKLFKSKTEVTQTPFETNPWKPQQGYLTSGFAGAESAKNNALASNAAITDFTADMTPEQIAAIRAGTSFAGNFAPKTDAVINAGSSTVGNLAQYGSNAGAFVQGFGQNRTGQVINDAGRMADSPYLQGQIDSAINDVNRGFKLDLGNINSGAVGTGNMNSTRAGVTESLARDDAMDRAAMVSSTMRGDAYGSGLDLASQNIDSMNRQMLDANSQLGLSASQGVDTMSAGYNMGQGALQDQAAGFAQFQMQNQAEIDGLRAKGVSEQEIMKYYMDTVGGNYGQQGFTSTASKTASPFQQLIGGATSIMGGIGAMKGA